MDTRTISICSGYGGIELGLSAVVPGIRTVCYVENEVSVCEILGARIKDGLLDDAPVWTDLRTFDATAWRGRVHLITGGFPCQPHSVAGNRKGADDSRELSGEVLRIAEELGYPTLFLENVPGIRKFWYYTVRPRLQSMGYRVEELLVTAAETGAPHKRQRLFILAHHDIGQSIQSEFQEGSGFDIRGGRNMADTTGGRQLECGTLRQEEGLTGEESQPMGSTVRTVADTAEQGLQGIRTEGSVNVNPGCNPLPLYPPGPDDTRGWESVYSEVPSLIPTFCRVAYGPTPWLDQRLRAIGNGVVPAVAARAWQILSRRFIEEVTTGYTDDF